MKSEGARCFTKRFLPVRDRLDRKQRAKRFNILKFIFFHVFRGCALADRKVLFANCDGCNGRTARGAVANREICGGAQRKGT
jgi:hypothetical protein